MCDFKNSESALLLNPHIASIQAWAIWARKGGEFNVLESFVRNVGTKLGIEITRISTHLSDLSPQTRKIIERARPFTMTSLERLAAVCASVEYAVKNDIPGAFVECGVWKGGSSMTAAWKYLELGRKDIDLFLFDTFEGMPEPSENDVLSSTGQKASDLIAKANKSGSIKAYSPIEDVRRNLGKTGFPSDRIHFVKGKVEETIPAYAPEAISILRLDTDWYASTKHELIHLFPRLSKNGVLIIDDYGHWAGARKAVDEYFAAQISTPLLNRIDGTGRICVKS